MLEMLMNPGNMTQAQWIVIGILVLLVIGVVFFIYRIYLIIRDAGKNKYTPNIGLPAAEKKDSGPDNSPDDKDNNIH